MAASRSVYTEVATDLEILVDHCLFRLHKVDADSVLFSYLVPSTARVQLVDLVA